MNPPAMPVVLVLIDSKSRLVIRQDANVQVAIADERVDQHAVTLLPRENQAQEIYELLAGKFVVSPAEDHGQTAANAVRQLQSLNIITTGLKAAKEAS